MKIILTLAAAAVVTLGVTAQELALETPVIGLLGGGGEGTRECTFVVRPRAAGTFAICARSLGLELRIEVTSAAAAGPDVASFETTGGIGRCVSTLLAGVAYRVRVTAESDHPFFFGVRIGAADEAWTRAPPSDIDPLWRRARLHLAEDHDSEPSADSLVALYDAASAPELALEAALAAREALAWALRMAGPGSPLAVACHFRCAASAARLGLEPEEERSYQDGITAGAAAGEGADANVAVLESDYGRFCFKRRRFDDAHRHFARALELRERSSGPLNAQRDTDLLNLGAVLAAKGSGREALPWLEAALRLRESRVGREAAATANVLTHLAVAYRAEGRMEDAVRHAREAVGIRRKVDGKRARSTAVALGVLCTHLIDSGRFADARPVAEEALGIVTELEGTCSGQRAQLLFDLGTIASASGEWAVARRLLEESVPLLERTDGTRSKPSIGARTTLAIVFGKLGDLPRARKSLGRLRL